MQNKPKMLISSGRGGAHAASKTLIKKSARPIPAKTVRLIQERAEGIRLPESFGAVDDLYEIGFEYLLPSLVRADIPSMQSKIRIGSSQCQQPYAASLLNCSALSFGPMGRPFIIALNRAAKLGEFFQNTGEAGISPYHYGVDVDVEDPDFNMDSFISALGAGEFSSARKAGDVVWQIGTGYFGCRKINGDFDPVQFERKATFDNIKMIEVKLSQGVETRKEMPVGGVSAGMTKILGINWEKQAVLKDEHTSFSSPVGLLRFVKELRALSGGKPVGIKMGISHRHYFLAICKAMLKTGILVDFFTIDGMEAGSAAASKGAFGFTGTPLNDSILFVHNALVGVNLRREIKIIASGQMFSEKEMISTLARGADLCSTARGMMLAVGCDQQRECYKGTCQKGIATQDPALLKKFDIMANMKRILNYHQHTVAEVMELLAIAGLSHPSELGPCHLQKRVSSTAVLSLDEVYEFLTPGALLAPFPWMIPQSFQKPWRMAKPEESFVSSLQKKNRSICR